jgi:hypothetical protein
LAFYAKLLHPNLHNRERKVWTKHFYQFQSKAEQSLLGENQNNWIRHLFSWHMHLKMHAFWYATMRLKLHAFPDAAMHLEKNDFQMQHTYPGR